MSYIKIIYRNKIVYRNNIQYYPFNIAKILKINAHKTEDITKNSLENLNLTIQKKASIFVLESNECLLLNSHSVRNALIKNGDQIIIKDWEIYFYEGFETSNDNLKGSFFEFLDILCGKNQNNQYQIVKASRKNPNEFLDLKSKLASFNKIFNSISNYTNIHSDNLPEFFKTLNQEFPAFKRSIVIYFKDLSLKESVHIPFLSQESDFLFSKSLILETLNRKCIVYHKVKHLQKNLEAMVFCMPIFREDEILGFIVCEIDNKKLKPNDQNNIISILFKLSKHLYFIINKENLEKELKTTVFGTIDLIISVIEAKDTYTAGHSERVADLSMLFSDALGLDKKVRKQLVTCAKFHDIGKIAIPDNILKKASNLSKEEFSEMKLHPVIGESILSHLPNIGSILPGVKHHHEKWNGTGYPDKLKEEQIPFFSRIISICDSFDAIVSGRTYFGFQSEENALKTLDQDRKLYDPKLLTAFIKMIERLKI